MGRTSYVQAYLNSCTHVLAPPPNHTCHPLMHTCTCPLSTAGSVSHMRTHRSLPACSYALGCIATHHQHSFKHRHLPYTVSLVTSRCIPPTVHYRLACTPSHAHSHRSLARMHPVHTEVVHLPLPPIHTHKCTAHSPACTRGSLLA